MAVETFSHNLKQQDADKLAACNVAAGWRARRREFSPLQVAGPGAGARFRVAARRTPRDNVDALGGSPWLRRGKSRVIRRAA
jgi:hypothetical protein